MSVSHSSVTLLLRQLVLLLRPQEDKPFTFSYEKLLNFDAEDEEAFTSDDCTSLVHNRLLLYSFILTKHDKRDQADRLSTLIKRTQNVTGLTETLLVLLGISGIPHKKEIIKVDPVEERLFGRIIHTDQLFLPKTPGLLGNIMPMNLFQLPIQPKAIDMTPKPRLNKLGDSSNNENWLSTVEYASDWNTFERNQNLKENEFNKEWNKVKSSWYKSWSNELNHKVISGGKEIYEAILSSKQSFGTIPPQLSIEDHLKFKHLFSPSDDVISQDYMYLTSLYVLQGVESEHFFWHNSKFNVCPVRLESTTHLSLMQVLKEFARSGSHYRYLKKLYIIHNSAEKDNCGFVRQAFAKAINVYLEWYVHALKDLHTSSRQQKQQEAEIYGDSEEDESIDEEVNFYLAQLSDVKKNPKQHKIHENNKSPHHNWDNLHIPNNNSTDITYSILQLHLNTTKLRDQLAWLVALCKSCSIAEQVDKQDKVFLLEGPLLLSYLYQRVSSCFPGEFHYHLSRFLFHYAIQPYHHILSAWLYHGVLRDPHGEFIAMQTSLDAQDKNGRVVSVKTFIERSGAAVPSFLEDWEDDIMACGQLLSILRAADKQYFTCCVSPIFHTQNTQLGILSDGILKAAGISLETEHPLRVCYTVGMLRKLVTERETLAKNQKEELQVVLDEIAHENFLKEAENEERRRILREYLASKNKFQKEKLREERLQDLEKKQQLAESLADQVAKNRERDAKFQELLNEEENARELVEVERLEKIQKEKKALEKEYKIELYKEQAALRRIQWRTKREMLSLEREELWNDIEEMELHSLNELSTQPPHIRAKRQLDAQKAIEEQENVWALRYQPKGERTGEVERKEEINLLDKLSSPHMKVRYAFDRVLSVPFLPETPGEKKISIAKINTSDDDKNIHNTETTIEDVINEPINNDNDDETTLSSDTSNIIMLGDNNQITDSKNKIQNEEEEEEEETSSNIHLSPNNDIIPLDTDAKLHLDSLKTKVIMETKEEETKEENEQKSKASTPEMIMFDFDQKLKSQYVMVKDEEPKETEISFGNDFTSFVRASLVGSVDMQCRMVNKIALCYLTETMLIEQHFTTLRGFLLFHYGNIMHVLATAICHTLNHTLKNQTTNTKYDLSKHTLRHMLHNVLKSCEHFDDPLTHRLQILYISPNQNDINEAKNNAEKAFMYLNGIRFSYRVQWPLNLVLTDDIMDGYTKVSNFFLQLKKVHHDLRETWILFQRAGRANVQFRKRRRGRQTEEDILLANQLLFLQGIRGQMEHLISILEGYVMWQVLEVSWSEFRERMDEATTIADVRNVHKSYINKALHRCFLTPQEVLIANILHPIFLLIVLFREQLCEAMENEESNFEAVKETAELFRVKMLFLYEVVNKLASKGHLQIKQLLIRLDFNSYLGNVKRG